MTVERVRDTILVCGSREWEIGTLTMYPDGSLDFRDTSPATPESTEPELATCALAVAATELRHAIEAFAKQGWFAREPEPELDYHAQLDKDSKRRD